jgi:hypothetical protein
MKTKMLVTMSILTAALQFAPVAFAQDEDQSGRPGWNRRGQWQNRMSNLSADERQKMQAAEQKAMQDPAVQSAREKLKHARKEFRDSMRAAMLKADPSVQPILDKMPKGGRGDRDED